MELGSGVGPRGCPYGFGQGDVLDLRIDHLRASITTHDAGNQITAADFDLARRIDAIVAAHQSLPLD
ncbi:4a-hydroxytetrahydrobiopterin dehydratase [Streptomyces sp. XY332]|uniref:4a-hydroxytetrahydrobiopterin dehydratase n=1 Tax=Streptomyces sp. XY332 TaxID=1415561 RepID=UPI000AFC200F